MQYTDPQLRIEIQAKGCNLPPDERARMHAALAPVGEAARAFPTADLWLKVIHHPRSQTYHVEAKLKLPGRTIQTGDEDAYLDSAFQRCARKLLRRVEDYKEH